MSPTRNIRLRKRPRRNTTARVGGNRGLSHLVEIYHDLNGFGVTIEGLNEYKTTYGEVTDDGIKVLSDKFTQYFPVSKMSAKQRTFYDLGCGIGRLNLGMAILHPEIQSIGVEIVPDRVKQAHSAIERLNNIVNITKRINIIERSIFDPTININNACWIFVSNLCYDESIMSKLYNKLESECKKGCVIICSRALPLLDVSRLEQIEENVIVPMTWDAKSSCIIYMVK
jgi:SAM-dependent methyltransferase